ncbi:hypothetical protein bcere0005_54060 [Bacillus cereus 172560W]|nr:hypothetical protein bcere0005_54060 [Bacillus cereus 172560W]
MAANQLLLKDIKGIKAQQQLKHRDHVLDGVWLKENFKCVIIFLYTLEWIV